MSKICGVVTEYNPFHNGHLYHLEQSRQETGADTIIAVMSGDFVQRGEPAIIDKYKRTQMALLCGADMVIELPVAHATSSAEGFAAAACRLLAATNIVDALCFGSEAGEIDPLIAIARHLCNETEDFKQILKKQLASGVSFPVARATALKSTFGPDADIINTPNNILGIEYLKAIIKYDLPMVPYTIKRQGAEHNSEDFLSHSASAGAIRKFIRDGGDIAQITALMPKASYNILLGEHRRSILNNLDNFSPFLHYILHNMPRDRLAGLSGLSQALQNRLTASARQHYLISDVLAATKTKSHTHTALQRAVVHILLGINTPALRNDAPYIRVLGFRREKEGLLRRLHATASLPVITNLKHTKDLPPYARNMLDLEIAATKAFWLGLRHNGVPEKNEFERPMIMV
ncbi:MAG: nucleotidyltransferase [Defluviitaleaceae bacterium]|nr:nucleotidyltransferase [Defluviitaleaceae bacterium]